AGRSTTAARATWRRERDAAARLAARAAGQTTGAARVAARSAGQTTGAARLAARSARQTTGTARLAARPPRTPGHSAGLAGCSAGLATLLAGGALGALGTLIGTRTARTCRSSGALLLALALALQHIDVEDYLVALAQPRRNLDHLFVVNAEFDLLLLDAGAGLDEHLELHLLAGHTNDGLHRHGEDIIGAVVGDDRHLGVHAGLQVRERALELDNGLVHLDV